MMKTFGVGGLSIVVLILSVGLTSAKAQADWPTFRGGFANSGWSHVSLAGAANTEPTSLTTQGLVWGTPVIDATGAVYVGSSDKHFYKINPDGRLAWRAAILNRADALIDSAAALTKSGKVVVPGGDGFLHAYATSSGAELWTFKATAASDSDQSSGVVVNSFEGNVQVGPDGTLYAGSDNGALYAVDERDGHALWSFRTKMMVWSSPVVDAQNQWLAFGSLDHHVYLLDPATGALLDSFDAGSDVKASLTTDGHGGLFFGDAAGDAFRLSVESRDGHLRLKKIWKVSTGGEIYSSSVALADGSVVFGSLDGRVRRLDGNGRLVWTFNAHSPISASPLLSADGAIVIGAKNGVIYALSAASGERLWSFHTSETLFKANVDSSPVLRPDGTIVVGSYSGLVHFVPAGYCPAHTADPRCAFGGSEDFPDFGGPVAPDQALVRLAQRDGRLATAAHDVGRYAPITLKLIALEKGHLIDRASVDALGLSVVIEPATKLGVHVASDGESINVLPEELAANTRYRIHVRGRYYRSTSWLADRFRWFGLRKFDGSVEITTGADVAVPNPLPAHWAMGSMYLTQPQSLDTYIPAGLDGQAYVGTPFAAGEVNGRFLILMQPALPAEPAPLPLAEPARAFVLEASRVGDDVRATGAMTVSAMGGTIPFKSVVLSGRVAANGAIERGDLFVQTSCLSIRGNGSSYHFPTQLLSRTCDYSLRLFGLGQYLARPLESVAPPAAGEKHFVSVVRYDPATLAVTGSGFVVTDGKARPTDELARVKLAKGSRSPTDQDVVQVFVDQTAAAKFPVRAWPGGLRSGD